MEFRDLGAGDKPLEVSGITSCFTFAKYDSTASVNLSGKISELNSFMQKKKSSADELQMSDEESPVNSSGATPTFVVIGKVPKAKASRIGSPVPSLDEG